MKSTFVALFVSLFLIFTDRAEAENKQVAMYRGLTPGISTLDDTVRILGKPTSKILNNNRTICKYTFVEVSIIKKTDKVNAIMIYDRNFKDMNGISIGDPYEKVRNLINGVISGSTVLDKKNGIIYSINPDNVVDSIVYGTLLKE